jgi:signal transduction histidine kinase
MRLLVKGALGLAIAYLVLLAAMAVGVERSLSSLEADLSSQTVRLLAREQANLVIERSMETLRDPDVDSRRRLHERIEDLTLLSEVVTSLSVVDKVGRVLASETPGRAGREAPPAALFGVPPQPRLERSSSVFRGGGDYLVLLPLLEGHELVGYLRVGLHSNSIAALYEQGRWRTVVLGGLGLAAVGVLGALLQVQLSRRTAAIAATLDGVPPPSGVIAPGDEFARVLRSASRVKGDLDEARRESERRGLHVGALARLLRVGVVLAGRELQPEYVSARARELCGCDGEADFREAWGVLEPGLRRALDEPAPSPDEGRSRLVEVRAGHTVQTEIHRLDGPGEDYLVVLSDPRALEAVENDTRLLRQLEGLGRTYRTLAHELRAPLGAVMLNLDLLQENIGGGGSRWNDRARRCVGVLRSELQRLNSSLHGIFTQTLPEASPQTFDLAGSLSDLGALLAPQARRQSVELLVRVPDAPLPVRGYPDRLRQALLNVAVNALEAMPRGGRLTLEARRDGTQARIAVRDTGPGIPPAALPRVYDPDFTTKNGGSGIGLHVARAVVELHGGEIAVESEPGRGTSVLVVVPLAAASVS